MSEEASTEKKPSWLKRNKAWIALGTVGTALLGSSIGYALSRDAPVETIIDTNVVQAFSCEGEPTTRTFDIEAYHWGYQLGGEEMDTLDVCLGDTVILNLDSVGDEHVTVDDGHGGTHVVGHGLGFSMGGELYKVEAATGESSSLEFVVNEEGQFAFYCTVFCGMSEDGSEGHHTMRGTLDVHAREEAPLDQDDGDTGLLLEDIVDVARDPLDLPAALNRVDDQLVQVSLTAREVIGEPEPGTQFEYWTFDGEVPGPMIRASVGDTIELTLTNDMTSKVDHNIDLHAVTGPGGGAVLTKVAPGESKTVTFQALKPGAYIYHCATPTIPMHMTNGMYGLIVVEPDGGFPEVDHEFYVVQGELYTVGAKGADGLQDFSMEKMLDETATYVVFNGRTGALVDKAPTIDAGDSVRIFFGNAGVSYISSFHVIGEIFDTVYHEGGSLENHDVQTTLVPAGGATIVEFEAEVPGTYILVDHALVRLEKGAVGLFHVEGDERPDIYR